MIKDEKPAQKIHNIERNVDSTTARGLLATDHVILNHGQVTWTTPELAPPSPNYHTTPTGGHFTNGKELLNRIVTGEETWIAHVNIETKQQSMAQVKPAEESLSNFVSEETDAYHLLGYSRNLAYRIHDTWNNNEFRSLLSHVEETEKIHPEQTSLPTEFWGCASAR
ncbi:HTH_48 domain-containing protein [Trichonephila clavipes]|uniref:HTH_48 domain-containing protein n=1 Tax=Trichonephila clavipes TaxID=2585209 RepID=A0A8X6WDH6_TRICX|nr:HTH_48 domain-containing protein [Trichonephila clavipes]